MRSSELKLSWSTAVEICTLHHHAQNTEQQLHIYTNNNIVWAFRHSSLISQSPRNYSHSNSSHQSEQSKIAASYLSQYFLLPPFCGSSLFLNINLTTCQKHTQNTHAHKSKHWPSWGPLCLVPHVRLQVLFTYELLHIWDENNCGKYLTSLALPHRPHLYSSPMRPDMLPNITNLPV